jgi:hypothetical protein
MKISPWDFVTLLLLIITACMLMGFVAILTNPQTPLNLFPPPRVPTQIILPTASATFLQIPATWTATYANSAVVSSSRLSVTPSPSSTIWIMPTNPPWPTSRWISGSTSASYYTATEVPSTTPYYEQTVAAWTREAAIIAITRNSTEFYQTWEANHTSAPLTSTAFVKTWEYNHTAQAGTATAFVKTWVYNHTVVFPSQTQARLETWQANQTLTAAAKTAAPPVPGTPVVPPPPP